MSVPTLPVCVARPAYRSSRGSPVHAFECLDEVRHDRAERRRQRRLAGDQDIVEVALGVIGADAPDRRLEAPPDAIALDRLADLPGDGEAEPRLLPCGCAAVLAVGVPWPRARTPAVPIARPCGPAETPPRLFSVVTPGAAPFAAFARALAIGHPSLPAAVSRREALAALGTPPGHDPAAAGRGHALAETMPALAHELARLIGPFHVGSPFSCKPLPGRR